MSPVEFKKRPCRPFEFKGQGPSLYRGGSLSHANIGRFLMDKKQHSLLVSMNTLAYLQHLYIKFASALYLPLILNNCIVQMLHPLLSHRKPQFDMLVSWFWHSARSGRFGKLQRFKSNSQSQLSPLHRLAVGASILGLLESKVVVE